MIQGRDVNGREFLPFLTIRANARNIFAQKSANFLVIGRKIPGRKFPGEKNPGVFRLIGRNIPGRKLPGIGRKLPKQTPGVFW